MSITIKKKSSSKERSQPVGLASSSEFLLKDEDRRTILELTGNNQSSHESLITEQEAFGYSRDVKPILKKMGFSLC